MSTDPTQKQHGYIEKSSHRKPWSCRFGDPDCTKAKPCRRCRGRSARRKGKDRERVVRKDLERALDRLAVRTQGAATVGEEAWHGLPVRVEVKSGTRVKGLGTLFLKAEKQSEDARPVGDVRPFVMDAEPDGMGDGIILIRRSTLRAVLDAFCEPA